MCVSPVSAQSFQLREITLGEFEWIIFSIRSSSACGSDNVCVRMLKLGFPAIGGVILHTINTCLIQSDIPDSWKHSIVHPLFKTGKPSDPANFRPISQVPVIMKVVEHTVHHKLYIYLPHNHLLAPSQHGFRPRHSTETALLFDSEQILAATDKGDLSMLCLLDAPRWGGQNLPPSWVFSITSKPLQISTQNVVYLILHQFDI